MGEVDLVRSPRSAYLHIPFCHRRCFYCDFAVVPLGDKASGVEGPGSLSIKSYLDFLHREIALVPIGPPLSTVYIGGGTPSLLSPSQISSLLNHLQIRFGLQYGAEITLEIDPASFNENDLKGYLDAGINRVSLGVQSFEDIVLERLGRRHRRNHVFEACRWIHDFYKSGRLSTWSLDLIQGVSGQNLAAWKRELGQAIGTFAPHLSIYELSVEPGTVFAVRERRGEPCVLDEDEDLEISRCTSSMLCEAGFARYEISNYALPGHTSRHNRVYWSGSGWWGFGQGATSAPWGVRFARPRTSQAYKSWVEEQESQGLEPSLQLTHAGSMDFDEQLMVGLRRREGVDLMLLAKRWGWDQKQSEEYLSRLLFFWKDAIERGWLTRQGWRLQLSDPLGMEISNQVLVQMMLWWESLPDNAVAVSKFGGPQYKVDAREVMVD